MPAFTETKLNAAALALADYGLTSTIADRMSTAVRVTGVRIEQRTEMDVLVSAGEAAKNPTQAGAGTASKPFQTSLAVGLRTENVTRQGRGRMFWPMLSMPLNTTTLRIDAAITQALATAFWTFLTGTGERIQLALAAGPFDPAVFSRVGAAIRPVVRVEVGDVLDVQRKRRDKAIENRAVAP